MCVCVHTGGVKGKQGGGWGCGQTGAVGFTHLIPVFHRLLKHKVCRAGNNSFLLLCVGDWLPVPAILRETVRAVMGVCLCVPTCVHKWGEKGPPAQSMPKTKPSLSSRWNFLLHTHTHQTTKHTHASEQSHLALYTFSTLHTAVPILSADPLFLFSKRPSTVWFVLLLHHIFSKTPKETPHEWSCFRLSLLI